MPTIPEERHAKASSASPETRCSVIIPARNAAGYIAQALRSVQQQNLPGTEVIVVDDGSEDDTATVVQGFGDQNVHYIRQTHQGVSAARNAGLAAAAGTFVLFLDADDWLLPGALQRLVQALEAAPQCVLLYGEAAKANEAGETYTSLISRLVAPRPTGDVLKKILQFNFIATPGAVLARTDVVRSVGGFKEGLRVAEDWVFWCALATWGHFAYLPHPPVVAYRVTPGSVSSTAGLEVDCTLSCIEEAFAIPNVVQRLGTQLPRLRRRRDAKAHTFVAIQHLKMSNFPLARKHLRQSLTLEPFQAREWILYACAATGYLPGTLRKIFK